MQNAEVTVSRKPDNFGWREVFVNGAHVGVAQWQDGVWKFRWDREEAHFKTLQELKDSINGQT